MPASAFADLIIHMDLDPDNMNSPITAEDNTWAGYKPFLLTNTVKLVNGRMNYNKNCLNVFDLGGKFMSMYIGGLWLDGRQDLYIRLSTADLENSTNGDVTLGNVVNMITPEPSPYQVAFAPWTPVLGYSIGSQIRNTCQTPQGYEITGAISLGYNDLLIPYKIYGTVAPPKTCSISLPSTINIGEYSAADINEKSGEVSANIYCTQNARANISFKGQKVLTDSKNCMRTDKENDLVFCISANSQPVDLTGETAQHTNSSDETVKIVAKAIARSTNVIGNHRATLQIIVSPD